MSVRLVRFFAAWCDGVDDPGAGDCQVCCEEAGDREDALKRALEQGWLRKGRNLYCPSCRGRYEKKKDGA